MDQNTNISGPAGELQLSIIIPVYNRAGLIKHTLNSLDPAHHPGVTFEVIVVDDGSDDDTWTVIERQYPHVRLFRNEKKGAAAARNLGLAKANGKYIMYLDSDDLVGENYFLKKIALLEADPEYLACYGEYEVFRSDGAFSPGQVIFSHKYPLLDGYRNGREHLTNFLAGNFTPPHTIIWQRRFLVKIKGHDELLAINQDVELFIRAIFKGLRITAVHDDTRVYVRQHNVDSRVGDPKNNTVKWRQILELRKKIFAELRVYAYDEAECYEAMGGYLFSYWKLLRHTEPALATAYLNFAKEVYWPVSVKGGVGFRLMAALLGPVKAVELKYYLLKRD